MQGLLLKDSTKVRKKHRKERSNKTLELLGCGVCQDFAQKRHIVAGSALNKRIRVQTDFEQYFYGGF